jgi:hypothetical protein
MQKRWRNYRTWRYCVNFWDSILLRFRNLIKYVSGSAKAKVTIHTVPVRFQFPFRNTDHKKFQEIQGTLRAGGENQGTTIR